MNYEKTFNKLSERVRDFLAKSPRCHDWDHTVRVLNNARMLAKVEKKVDIRVIEIAALFHDIARADELSIQGKICHAKKGAEITRQILLEEGLNENFIEKVAKCVKRHRFRSGAAPQTLEDKIVYDADKLDSLGAVGLGRAFLFAGRIGAKVHNTSVEALNSKSYSENDTAYREYLFKLKDLPKKMLTETGRAIAAKRVAFMDKFFKKLDEEIYGSEY
ncbi:MAG TPA: phosphohydrolase [Lentisphaeria bacterium]|nr:phosphohydrolase [Lentisphaeria bacterium]